MFIVSYFYCDIIFFSSKEIVCDSSSFFLHLDLHCLHLLYIFWMFLAYFRHSIRNTCRAWIIIDLSSHAFQVKECWFSCAPRKFCFFYFRPSHNFYFYCYISKNYLFFLISIIRLSHHYFTEWGWEKYCSLIHNRKIKKDQFLLNYCERARIFIHI